MFFFLSFPHSARVVTWPSGTRRGSERSACFPPESSFAEHLHGRARNRRCAHHRAFLVAVVIIIIIASIVTFASVTRFCHRRPPSLSHVLHIHHLVHHENSHVPREEKKKRKNLRTCIQDRACFAIFVADSEFYSLISVMRNTRGFIKIPSAVLIRKTSRLLIEIMSSALHTFRHVRPSNR